MENPDGEKYREATKDILRNVTIREFTGAGNTSNPYKADYPSIYVPGCLEFAGLVVSFAMYGLEKSGLRIYSGQDELTNEEDIFPDMFPHLNEPARIALLERTDPDILGLACEGLTYSHQLWHRMVSEKKFGWEGNFIISAGIIVERDNPFSPELTQELRGWMGEEYHRKTQPKGVEQIRNTLAAYDLEQRIIKELGSMALEGRRLR